MSKKYYKFMKNITADELYEGLLGYGLFNEKLPPFLSSKAFFDYCQAYNPTFNSTKKEQSYIYYENMRNINIPRSLGIPNPMAYQKLCLHLKDNWDEIIEHFRRNTINDGYKKSRIHIRKIKESKKIFEMNYKNFKSDGTPEPDLLIGSRFLVNADISTCFPSMYTHSLSWALVGKDTAKSNKNKRNEWYNQLDFYVRNTTNGETHGFLIGPHTSNVLSEIILTSVDYELSKKKWNYIRHVDDYTCYVTSYEEGQNFLLDLSEQLRYYNLILNHKKTTITPLPMAATEQWIRRLNSFLKYNKKDYMDFKDVRAYLDLAIQLVHENNNSAILKYAIKVVAKKELTKNAIDYFVKNVFHISIIYPYLVPLLEDNVFNAFKVNIKQIMEYSHLLYKEGLQANNFEEVSYAIYFALKYNFVFDHLDFKEIRSSNHCLLLLLTFLYCDYYKINTEVKKFKRLARELNKDKEDFGQYWLFIYESLPKSDLKGDWKDLKDKKISFVKGFIGEAYTSL
ncbi:RNA-directed DNA polymerase [Bacillus shivajii]|uniref:RNA-directed DNA polymerase n=1 Tax=Bacillus shivajii TaxID=1983719 RepID=UPI001CFC3135|nr:RNA-directed DNA polymerase [Bacillus shivajii]UCZ53467.1 RNA-directed DNA polymerase [Bacillus shivajii]